MHYPGERSGTVFIAEKEDRDEPFMLTGRFDGHLERDRRLVESFEDLSVDDALIWGRARADVVLIRVGDRYHSAGTRNPDPDETPAWPADGIRLDHRRYPGFEALDNTEADAPVLWDVRIRVDWLGPVHPRRFHDAVRRNPLARDVRAPAPGYPELSASFLVEAATLGLAERMAEAIGEAARRELRKDVPSLRVHASAGLEVYPHRPGRAVTGPGIIY